MPQNAFTVRPLRAFQDNYIWSLEWSTGDCVIVDPGDAEPVLAHLEVSGQRLSAILITHHHADHTGGLSRLLDLYQVPVYGPGSGRIKGIDHPVAEGDQLDLHGSLFRVLEIPGHTLDHIAFFSLGNGNSPATDSRRATVGNPPRVFCGDTLFAGGCGRIFEGTPELMYQSLQKLARLPSSTDVYCAHEYTLANLRFAQQVDPRNEALARRQVEAAALRHQDLPTLPSNLELELATNPFLRCKSDDIIEAAQHQNAAARSEVSVFATLREMKNRF